MTRRALVTGATGQDGRYAIRLLAGQGYEVVGTTRDPEGVRDWAEPARLVRCSLADQAEVTSLIADVRPTEIYNFAAFSTGSGMFDDPIGIGDINGLGPVRLLEAIRCVDPTIRFLQASSSEMFGFRSPAPQSETTPLDPRSPYGAAKQFAHTMVNVYREHHGLFAASAILFNHESPLRSPAFVTRKVTRAAAMIALGFADRLEMGDLDAQRDWGFAGDYVRAGWMMLQADSPRDHVIATGCVHSVRDLCSVAFAHAGLDYRDFVRQGVGPVRPRANIRLIGDASGARKALGWLPLVPFAQLIAAMVDADLADLSLAVKGT